MRELIINNSIIRIFDNNLVKIYCNSQEEADKIWNYLNQEEIIE